MVSDTTGDLSGEAHTRIRKGFFDMLSSHIQHNESMRSLVGELLSECKGLEEESFNISHQLKVCSAERDYWKRRALSDE
jgi:hypothetical protein